MYAPYRHDTEYHLYSWFLYIYYLHCMYSITSSPSLTLSSILVLVEVNVSPNIN